MRKALISGLLAFIIGLAVPTSAWRNAHDPAFSFRTLNKFERAQKQTVLVTSSDGQGSAVIVWRSNQWWAFTAAHVVEGDEFVKISVQHRHQGRKTGVTTYTARVITTDEFFDLALLKVDASPDAFLSATFASDAPARVGDPVFACGNFLGKSFEGSISTGVISQIGVDPGNGFPWLQTDQMDCAAFPGSSGGPVFNARGEVLGLVVGGKDSALVWFVPTRAISEFLRQSKIGWAK